MRPCYKDKFDPYYFVFRKILDGGNNEYNDKESQSNDSMMVAMSLKSDKNKKSPSKTITNSWFMLGLKPKPKPQVITKQVGRKLEFEYARFKPTT